jgi:glycosyltransferase involved in cell wall biosynthesis
MNKEVVALMPTWYTATHALNAYKSFRQFYPDIPLVFVNDKQTPQAESDWRKMHAGWNSFDPDYSKIIGLPNTAYIEREHEGFETTGLGTAVTDAMKFIHSKWVLLISDDIRFIKGGFLEDMFKDTNDTFCGIGDDWARGFVKYNLAKWFCLFRGDLYHRYNLDFHGDFNLAIDAGAPYWEACVKKGFEMKFMGLDDYFLHLGAIENANWKKYYEI